MTETVRLSGWEGIRIVAMGRGTQSALAFKLYTLRVAASSPCHYLLNLTGNERVQHGITQEVYRIVRCRGHSSTAEV